jgi:hypothetical protein
MALRLGALHDALLDPGNQEKAVRAAEEVASYEARIAALDSKLERLLWMVGTNVVLTSGVLIRMLWLR